MEDPLPPPAFFLVGWGICGFTMAVSWWPSAGGRNAVTIQRYSKTFKAIQRVLEKNIREPSRRGQTGKLPVAICLLRKDSRDAVTFTRIALMNANFNWRKLA
jgi:hypothetical protein